MLHINDLTHRIGGRVLFDQATLFILANTRMSSDFDGSGFKHTDFIVFLKRARHYIRLFSIAYGEVFSSIPIMR